VREFNSVGEFVTFLRRAAATAAVNQKRALQEAARVVQQEASDSIGHYQGGAGPFKDWAPLSEYTLNGWDTPTGDHYPGKIEMGFAPPDNPLLRTGELKYHIDFTVSGYEAAIGVPDEQVGDGTQENPYRNIGDVATDLELGTRYMEPRSFLGRALYVKTDEVLRIFVDTIHVSFEGSELLFGEAPPF
jgi:hypothetical protein